MRASRSSPVSSWSHRQTREASMAPLTPCRTRVMSCSSAAWCQDGRRVLGSVTALPSPATVQATPQDHEVFVFGQESARGHAELLPGALLGRRPDLLDQVHVGGLGVLRDSRLRSELVGSEEI